MMIVLIKARIPSTAIPSIRNGSRSSQTIGYKTSASKAMGQHSISRISHRRNVNTSYLPYDKYLNPAHLQWAWVNA